MNINVDAQTLATIKAQLEEELKSKPTSAIDKAFESAEEIRQNIHAIKGEMYLMAVDFGLSVNKAVHLNAALSSMVTQADPRSAIPVAMAGEGFARLMAGMLNDYCDALGIREDSEEFARELTEWIDRVFQAEQAGVKKLIKEN